MFEKCFVQEVYDEVKKELKRVATEGSGDPVLPESLLRRMVEMEVKTVPEAVALAVDCKAKPLLSAISESMLCL